MFVDPEIPLEKALNSRLTEMGYRRSGAHIYRPDCENCRACISCRVPTMEFTPRRSQRKILSRNKDLSVSIHPSSNEEGHYQNSREYDESFNLYRRYIEGRHADGDMYPATREQFQSFINQTANSSIFVHFRVQDQLVAVSVIDVLEYGLSAVYTFFEPNLTRRSLGVYAILWQINYARQQQLPHVYLGYWIKDCQKMKYKTDFRPLEFFVDGEWLKAT